MIIAVDFDGVIVQDNYPEIGERNLRVINTLLELKIDGHQLILWTCRTGKLLADAIDFCRSKGLIFDAVNQNLPEVIKKYKSDTRKVFADVYLDDRAVNYNITPDAFEFSRMTSISLNL